MQPRGEHRHERQRDEQGREQRKRDDVGQLLEHDADHAANENHRQKHDHRCQRPGNNGRRHLFASFDSGLRAFHAAFAQPRDVFQHDNGAIHHHADAEG